MTFRFLIAAFFLPASIAGADEVVCSEYAGRFVNLETREEVDKDIVAEIRVSSDKFVDLYVSGDFQNTKVFWLGEPNDRTVIARRFGTTKVIGSDTEHIETFYRQSYAVTEANGKSGYFVVTEYGTRTSMFDVIHSQVWKPTVEGWRVISIFNTYRCPLDSSPVKLSPNKALHFAPWLSVMGLAIATPTPDTGRKLAKR